MLWRLRVHNKAYTRFVAWREAARDRMPRYSSPFPYLLVNHAEQVHQRHNRDALSYTAFVSYEAPMTIRLHQFASNASFAFVSSSLRLLCAIRFHNKQVPQSKHGRSGVEHLLPHAPAHVTKFVVSTGHLAWTEKRRIEPEPPFRRVLPSDVRECIE